MEDVEINAMVTGHAQAVTIRTSLGEMSAIAAKSQNQEAHQADQVAVRPATISAEIEAHHEAEATKAEISTDEIKDPCEVQIVVVIAIGHIKAYN